MRRQSSSTSAVLASGGRLPVLALRRDGRDASILRSLLGSSNRIELGVVRPEGIVRTPLRWPADARAVPLALCVVVSERPAAVAAVERLVRHVGDVPVVAVVEAVVRSSSAAADAAGGWPEVFDALHSVGVDDVVALDGLTGPVLEQIVVGAIDRHDRGVLHLDDASDLLIDRQHLSA